MLRFSFRTRSIGSIYGTGTTRHLTDSLTISTIPSSIIPVWTSSSRGLFFMPEIVHQLFARYRFRSYFTLEKCGRIRYEIDPQTGLIVASRALVKLMPVGGFDGTMMALPLDAEPPLRQQKPARPAQLPRDIEAEQDEALYKSLYGQS